MRRRLFFIAYCLLLAPFEAEASSSGVISEIATNPTTGAVNFVVNGTRTNIPPCANGQGLRWAIDGSNTMAQSAIAVILSAFAQAKSVYVEGTGGCYATGQSNVESVSFVVMN